MKTIFAKDMKIGDVVKIANQTSAYSHSTVIQKEGEYVTLFRPYVSLANFTYTGGVIPYIGTEKYTMSIHSPVEHLLIDNIYRGETDEKPVCQCKGTFHDDNCPLRVN